MKLRIKLGTLAEKLRSIRSATFAGVTALTEPPLIASNPFNGNLRKLSVVNVTIAADYENSVNRQLDREGKETDFLSMPRKWGKRVSPALVEHKGKFYAPCHVNGSSYCYLLNGRLIGEDKVKPFLKPIAPGRQGTEKALKYRDYSLENVIRIKIKGNLLDNLH